MTDTTPLTMSVEQEAADRALRRAAATIRALESDAELGRLVRKIEEHWAQGKASPALSFTPYGGVRYAFTHVGLTGALEYLDSLTPQPVTGPSGWQYRPSEPRVVLQSRDGGTEWMAHAADSEDIPPCDRATVAALMERGK